MTFLRHFLSKNCGIIEYHVDLLPLRKIILMTLTPLSAISPIDGRYRSTTSKLANYFSEYALIKYRIFVEIEYFIALCEHPLPQLRDFDKSVSEKLRAIYRNFSEKDAESIKEIEKITNHDVKAVEYFIKQEFDKLGLEKYKEF